MLLDDGSIICFGTGGSGRLGYGDETARSGDSGSTPDQLTPVELPYNISATMNDRTAIQVSAGAEHTCAVLDDFTLTCWGEGDDGRLGYGNSTDVGAGGTPVNASTVRMPHNALVASVSAGETHTCATLRVGAVVCWGASPNGELGRGNNVTMGAVGWLQPGPAHSIVYPPLLNATDVVHSALPTPAVLCSASSSSSPTPSASPSGTPSVSGSPSVSSTPSATRTPSVTWTPSVTGTQSPSGTPSMTGTQSPSGTPSKTGTQSPSGTPSKTGTQSPSGTPSTTGTQSPSGTPPMTGTQSPSGTPPASQSATAGAEPTISIDESVEQGPVSEGDSSVLSAGAIAGIVVAGVVLLFSSALFVYCKRARAAENEAYIAPMPTQLIV